MEHRFGVGWRPELAAGILANLDHIDVLEVLAENYSSAPAPKKKALRSLGADVPLVLHGVSMGLASTLPVESKRLDTMARLIEDIRPESWSEHLAFVRAGGVEIGHLAAPPRTQPSVEGALENIRRARQVIGRVPSLENIATLIDPPASSMGEAEWTRHILAEADCPMLLDLHNLYANAVNLGRDPEAYLAEFPLERVGMVHLSGGHWIGKGEERRLLDDHLHDVPDPVFGLLATVAERASRPLTVILERDGRYPSFDIILRQLDQARRAVVVGESRRKVPAGAGVP